MPISPVSSITRQATNKGPLNILCGDTHERYQFMLAKTGHNFYSFGHQNFKTWDTTYSAIPENYVQLDGRLGSKQIPLYMDFDLVLSQNKFGQFQIFEQIAKQLHIPLVSLEHTLPIPQWEPARFQHLKQMRGCINVFISEFSLGAWLWGMDDDVRIIHHGVDTELFSNTESKRHAHILSVVNDWRNRDHCCNFQGWQRITQGLPVKVWGDNPGLSIPTNSPHHLAREYNSSRIFLNTSTVSPIPTSLLEAMSCGCACVSTATCMIPNIIKHGVNGFISNNESELRGYVEALLGNEELAKKLGVEARKTVQEMFGVESFLNKWNEVFAEASNIGVFLE